MKRIGALAAMGLAFAACAARAPGPLVDPFPLRFPLVEAGTLEIEGHVVGQPRARDGIVYFATREGFLTAVVVPSQSTLWRKPVGGSEPAPGGPADAFADPEGPALKAEGSKLVAIDQRSGRSWEFEAGGAIQAEPVQERGRVYFGDSDRTFYCLDAGTGKVKWRRRLQGAPLHAPIVRGRTIAVLASNSVVYRLSRRGGSILSWEAVPSRIVYDLAAAGPLVLVSSASPTITAIDLGTGKRAGQFEASGPLVAGAVWSPPYVVVFVEDLESGRQRLVFLRSR